MIPITVLEDVPIQIDIPRNQYFEMSLSQIATTSTFHLLQDDWKELGKQNKANKLHDITSILYTLHPCSFITVNKKQLSHYHRLFHHPILVFFNNHMHSRLPVPCVLWEVQDQDIVFLLSHRVVQERNINIDELKECNRATLLLHNTHGKKHHVLASPLLYCANSDDMYTALFFLRNIPFKHNTNSIIICDSMDIQYLLEHITHTQYKDILLSYSFLEENKTLLHTIRNYIPNHIPTIHCLHTLRHILCGFGSCRGCVKVQHNFNYEICRRGILQTPP